MSIRLFNLEKLAWRTGELPDAGQKLPLFVCHGGKSFSETLLLCVLKVGVARDNGKRCATRYVRRNQRNALCCDEGEVVWF